MRVGSRDGEFAETGSGYSSLICQWKRPSKSTADGGPRTHRSRCGSRLVSIIQRAVHGQSWECREPKTNPNYNPGASVQTMWSEAKAQSQCQNWTRSRQEVMVERRALGKERETGHGNNTGHLLGELVNNVAKNECRPRA